MTVAHTLKILGANNLHVELTHRSRSEVAVNLLCLSKRGLRLLKFLIISQDVLLKLVFTLDQLVLR